MVGMTIKKDEENNIFTSSIVNPLYPQWNRKCVLFMYVQNVLGRYILLIEITRWFNFTTNWVVPCFSWKLTLQYVYQISTSSFTLIHFLNKNKYGINKSSKNKRSLFMSRIKIKKHKYINLSSKDFFIIVCFSTS